MEVVREWGAGGALVVLVLLSVCPACDGANAIEVEQLCPPAACDGGDCASGAGGDCTGEERSDDAAGRPSVPAPTDVMVPLCTVCVRAENCCKAAGLADCHYTKACVSATPAVQQYYVAQCQAVLNLSASRDKTLPDVCGF
jgi:hypothetical protein